jgi:hypothetical protein
MKQNEKKDNILTIFLFSLIIIEISNYKSSLFYRFDLMYGVTELEKFHILPGVALLEGLSDLRRDEFIRDSVKVRKF